MPIMVSKISYEKCLKTMYGFRRFGIKLGLATIKKILKGLDNPQQEFGCIHIAGTNGKGSVAHMLAAICQSVLPLVLGASTSRDLPSPKRKTPHAALGSFPGLRDCRMGVHQSGHLAVLRVTRMAHRGNGETTPRMERCLGC